MLLMENDILAKLPYWSFGLATAGGFYGATLWIGSHLRPEFKRDLSHWLNGTNESTWAEQFCRFFDTAFGEKHLSRKCFTRSSLASILSVLLLYLLFTRVLGVLGIRKLGSMEFLEVFLVGVVINILPDYLSLLETRWLLGRFAKTHSFLGQLLLLLIDFIFTALIILLAISAYSWIFNDGKIPSLIELVGLFSVYAIFFYSTFLTSVWAWIYCLSTWFMRLFTRLGLKNVLDIKDHPVKQIALVGSLFVFLSGFVSGPAFSTGDADGSSRFNNYLCRLDLKACLHAARISKDTERIVHFMVTACGNEIDDGSCAQRLNDYFDGDSVEANRIWQEACDGGFARACKAIAWAYNYGEGMPVDFAKANTLNEKACEGGDMGACNNLGLNHERGDGVPVDLAKAKALYEQACEGGDMWGCNNLGLRYEQGDGVPVDLAKANALYEKACKGGDMGACFNLGWNHARGDGVPVDLAKANALYEKACEGGDMGACNNLGLNHERGDGVPVDFVKANALYEQACKGGDMVGCNNLGVSHEQGDGVPVDFVKANTLYEQACEGGHQRACERVAE